MDNSVAAAEAVVEDNVIPVRGVDESEPTITKSATSQPPHSGTATCKYASSKPQTANRGQ